MPATSLDDRTLDRLTTLLKSTLFDAGEAAADALERGTASLSGQQYMTTGAVSTRIHVRTTDLWKSGDTSLNMEMAAVVRSVVNMAIGAANWRTQLFTYASGRDQPIHVTIIAELTPGK